MRGYISVVTASIVATVFSACGGGTDSGSTTVTPVSNLESETISLLREVQPYQMERLVELNLDTSTISLSKERALISIDPQIDTNDFANLYVDLYLGQDEFFQTYVDDSGVSYISTEEDESGNIVEAKSTRLTKHLTRVKLDANGNYRGYVQTPANTTTIYAVIPSYPTFEIEVNGGVGTVANTERYIATSDSRPDWNSSNDSNGWSYLLNSYVANSLSSLSTAGGIRELNYKEPNAQNGFNIVTEANKRDLTTVLINGENATTTHPELFKANGPELNMQENGEVFVTFYYEGAGYKNTLGYYAYDDDGSITGKTLPTSKEDFRAKIKEHGKIIFPNSSANGSGGLLSWGDSVSLGEHLAGTKFIFFIVSNGWQSSGKVRNPDANIFTTHNEFNDEYASCSVPAGGVTGRYGISHVAIMLENGATIKIDNYPGDNKDYSDPQQYFNDIASTYGSNVSQYYIKASTNYYDPYSGAIVDIGSKGFDVKRNGRVDIKDVKLVSDFASSSYSCQSTSNTSVGNPTHNCYDNNCSTNDTIKDYSHVVLMKHPIDSNHNGSIESGEHTFIMGFEDINRTSGACDQDFEDVVFSIASNPVSALSGNIASNPTISTDSDGDGVEDVLDEFPNDSTRAYRSYYPSENSVVSLIYEDMWPAEADMDLNDLVLLVNEEKVTDALHRVKDIDVTFSVTASGANYDNGFSIKLDANSSNIESVVVTPTLYESISSSDINLEISDLQKNVETVSSEELAVRSFDGVDMNGTVTKYYSTHTNESYTGVDESDYVKYNQTQGALVDLITGLGDDKVYFNEHASGTTLTNEGDDQVYSRQMIIGSVDLGNGNNRLHSDEHIEGTITSGDGDDQLYTRQQFKGVVNTGSGNDTLISLEHLSGTIDLGSGNDYASTNQLVTGAIDGGDGYDVLRVGDQNAFNNWNSIKSRVSNFEKVIFSNGVERDIDQSGNFLDDGSNDNLLVGESTYSTTINLSIGAITQDSVNIRVVNLPSNVTLKDSNSNILTQTNSSVTLSLAKMVNKELTLLSSRALSSSELDAISVEVLNGSGSYVADGNGIVIDIFNNIKTTLGYRGNNGYYNTQVGVDKEYMFSDLDYVTDNMGDTPYSAYALNHNNYLEYSVKVTFKDAVDIDTIGLAPYNAFMRIDSDNSREVHLPNHSVTVRSGLSSSDLEVDYLSDANNLPWAVLIPAEFNRYPLETVHIEDAYVNYRAWVDSNFEDYANWWEDSSSNYVQNYIFQEH
jgi:hypothetical protein